MTLKRKDLVVGDIFRYVKDSGATLYMVVDEASSAPEHYIPSDSLSARGCWVDEVVLVAPSPARGTQMLAVGGADTKEAEVTAQTHYTALKPEPIEVMEAWFPTNPYRWQALKYLARAGRKGTPEDEVKDLRKSISYIQREINAKLHKPGWE